jgi:phosphohistidine phosphatase
MSLDVPTARGLELYFVRHADAGDPAAWPGDDSDRPLSEEGREQATRLGSYLKGLRIKPDALITSPKVRAADTAKLIGELVGRDVTMDGRLAGGLEADELGTLLREVDGQVGKVILVGHDPDFSSLVSWLAAAPVSLGKCALARIDLPDRSVRPGGGSLRWLLPPDAIPG